MSSGFGGEQGSPAVLGGEYTGREAEDVPQQVYISSQRLGPGAEEVNLELRPMQDGRLALLAYSSLDLLIAGCGEHQPWIAVPVNRVHDCQQQSGADVVLWDLELPEEMRHAPEEEIRG